VFYDFAITIPAGRTQADPVKQELKLCYGILRRVEVAFPAGCKGYVSLIINWREHQLYPTNPDEAFNAEEYTVPIDDYFPITVPPFSLFAVGWAPSAIYNHIITVRIGILPIEVAGVDIDTAKYLQTIVGLIGGAVVVAPKLPEELVTPPPPEEVVPTPPPEEVVPTPPPPEEEVPAPPPPPPTPPPEEVKPPARGTKEEAQLEIARKGLMGAAAKSAISAYIALWTPELRDKLEAWMGWRLVPEEMGAEMLAEWKLSYPYIDPFFTYASYYPTTTMTPVQYYTYKGIHELNPDWLRRQSA